MRLEQLEDRTLLSNLGDSLGTLFDGLQTSVNNNLLSPTQVSYSLPLVGTALGTNSSAQFLHAIGTTIKNANPNSYTDVQTALQSSSLGNSATVSQVSASEWEIQIKNAPAITINNLDFATGLPGLSKLNFSLPQSVTATINYGANFFFTVDSSGDAVLDATQNSNSTPLVQMDVSAQLNPSTGTIQIGSGNINLIPGGTASLNVPVKFNVDPSLGSVSASDAGQIANKTQITIDPSASANINLSLATNVGSSGQFQLPTLTLGLGLTWDLASNSTGDDQGPFNGTNYGQAPTLNLSLTVDTSSLGNFLSPLVGKLDAYLEPLQNVVNFFFQPIPVLSDVLGGSVTAIDILKDSGQASGLVDLLNAVNDILNFSQDLNQLDQYGSITLVHYTLPATDSSGHDLRDQTFDLSGLLSNVPLGSGLGSQASSVESEVQNLENAVNSALGGNALGSTVEMPMLDNPALLFKALLGNNVVLFQYTIPDQTVSPASFTLGPIPIVPPLALSLGFGIGITAGITLGYDTYGLMESNPTPEDGFFLTDGPSGSTNTKTEAQVTGSISLTAEADFGVAQAGGTGTVSLGLGVTGLDTSSSEPSHTATTENNQAETVLQLPDIINDISKGGPLCPFNVCGDITLGFSLFVTIGVSPFSITLNFNVGTTTLATFSVNTCGSPSSAVLAQQDTIGNISNNVGTRNGIPFPTADIQSKLPNTQNVLLLDMGNYEGLRNTGNPNDQNAQNEDFEVIPDSKDPTALDVIAFGQLQKFSGANNKNTTIVVIGEPEISENVEVDKGANNAVVHANAYFIGGPYQNSFDYSGDGDTYMVGGTWGLEDDPSDGQRLSADYNLAPVTVMNTLIGGSGHNTLVGGNLSGEAHPISPANGYPSEQSPQWNQLIGGPDGYNTLMAGSAGATLRAGNQNGDRLIGSIDSFAVQSHYLMVAGQGSDTMFAGQTAPVQTQAIQPLFTLIRFYGNYVFQWNERPDHKSHQLTVYAYNEINSTGTSELDIQGNQGYETWIISAISNGVQVQGTDNNDQSSNQDHVGEIDAYGIQKLSVDAHDQIPSANGKLTSTGGDVYNVGDLSTTTVTQMSVNLHQWSEQADQNPDAVNITGPQGNDTVQISTEGALIDPSSGEPNYADQWTNIQISTLVDATKSTVSYSVDTYLDKSTDTLALTTFGGNDSVSVDSTQPCQTNISTGAGDDTIDVGGGSDGLDPIEGPLFIDAGSGHNTIGFGDGGKFGDIVTLTTQTSPQGVPQGLLLRYQGQLLPGYTADGKVIYPHYRYPLDITFEAIGGDFMGGVSYSGPEVGIPYGVPVGNPDTSQIYVQRVLANAPTTIDMSVNKGSPTPSYDQVFVGFDGGSNGETHDPNSTLDGILSELTIKGNSHTSVIFDDEGSDAPQSYGLQPDRLLRTTNPGPESQAWPFIIFTNVAYVTLYSGNFDNSIYVTGTGSTTTSTSVYAGNGVNDIYVAQPVVSINGTVLGLDLDGNRSPLSIYGGTGSNYLSLDDSGDGNGHNYDLGSSSLTRDGIASIGFANMTSVVFNASAASSVGNNINIEGTAAGTSVTVNTGSGTNNIMVENLTYDSLDDIQGPLAIKEGAGATVNIAFYDEGLSGSPQVSEQYTLTSGSLARSGMGTITFDPVHSLGLYLRNNSDNEVNVDSNATVTEILAGSLSNQILVGDPQRETLDPIQGALTIFGTGSTVLSLEDQNAAVARSYVLSPKAFYFQGGFGPEIYFENLTGLVLDAGNQGNQINVEGTPAGTNVTINAGTNDQIDAGNSSLANIAGPLNVVGKGSNDALLLDDSHGTSRSTYVIGANSLEDGTIVIGYQNLASITLNGSLGISIPSLHKIRPDIYEVVDIPAVNQLALHAQGNANTLAGPNTNNTWEFSSTGDTLDQIATFTDMQRLVGGTGNDTFVFNGAVFSGSIDGGTSGTDSMDFSKNGSPVTVTVDGNGTDHGTQGTATGLAFGFNNIDSIIGDSGSNMDGSGFSGNFTSTLTVSGFANMNLNVPGNFTGKLLAPSEGTAALPVQYITIGGSLAAGAKIKVDNLNQLTIGGDLDGAVIAFGQIQSAHVSGNENGTIEENAAPGTDFQQLIIGGSLTGTVYAGSIATLSVGQDLTGEVDVTGAIGTLSVGNNLSGSVSAESLGSLIIGGNFTGQISVTGALGSMNIGGSNSGSISAGQINSLSARRATGSVLLNITQAGVQRELLASLVDPAASSGGPEEEVSYFYDGTTAIPQLFVRIWPPEQLPDPSSRIDLSLVVHGSGQFDLARLDSLDANGQPAYADLHDLSIRGDVLSSVSPAALQFFGLPAGTPGGVFLPLDDLGDVAAAGSVPARSIQGHSIQAVAFGTETLANGRVVEAQDADARNAAALLAHGTAIVQADGTFLATVYPASPPQPPHPSALFLATKSSGGRFDDQDVLFVAQTSPTVFAPNPISVQVTAASVHRPDGKPGTSVIQTIALFGDGGSIQTRQAIIQAITSTGPLGDLMLGSKKGLRADVTAPSIFGNILVHGPIAGTIQTTGQRIDPVTGAVTLVAADLGRLLSDSQGNVIGETQIRTQGEGITGRIISRGNLISLVHSDGDISGVVAAQGDLGALLLNPDGSPVVNKDGSLTRLGGIVANGGFSGQLVVLGNVLGDIHIDGGLSGRWAVHGRPVAGLDPSRSGVLGEVQIDGGIRPSGAILSGGLIGDAAGRTDLEVKGAIRGIVAAMGNINLEAKTHTKQADFFQGDLAGTPNGHVLESVFQSSFDVNVNLLDLDGLDEMLLALAALHVGKNGELTLT
ncbi:MAG: hypothetical protein ACYC3I_08120 [Gemmataceae bacterium]